MTNIEKMVHDYCATNGYDSSSELAISNIEIHGDIITFTSTMYRSISKESIDLLDLSAWVYSKVEN